MLTRLVQQSIVLCIAITSTNAYSERQRTDFDIDNNGLIEINDLGDLNNIRNHTDGAALYGQTAGCPNTGCIGFELTSDLDFDTNQDGQLNEMDDYWNAGKGWERIGEPEIPFQAVFEGNNHTINNLFIERPALLEVGLFGWTANATIRNLHLGESSLYVKGAVNVGGLAGFAIGTQISNCSSKVYIKAKGSAGGLVGRAQSSSIKTSYSTSNVDVSDNIDGTRAGGLVGFNSGGEVIASYASGDISADRLFAGGLLGYGNDQTKVIASYATGNVSALEYSGGLIGLAENMNVEASFSSGFVSGDMLTGGLIGSSENTNVSNSYWATDTSGQISSAVGIGFTLAELKCPTDVNNQGCSERTLYQDWNKAKNEEGLSYWHFGSDKQLPTIDSKKNGSANSPVGGSLGFSTMLMLILLLWLPIPLRKSLNKKTIGQ